MSSTECLLWCNNSLHMKHIMDLPLVWDFYTVLHWRQLFQDFKLSVMFWGEFYQRVEGFQICVLNPYLISFLIRMELFTARVPYCHHFLSFFQASSCHFMDLFYLFHSFCVWWNLARCGWPFYFGCVSHDHAEWGLASGCARVLVMHEFCQWQP